MKQFVAYISLGIGLLVTFIYFIRPDWAAAITIIPAWVWLCVWLLAIPARKTRIFHFATAVWLGYLVVNVSELRSIARLCIPVNPPSLQLTVTTLNCAGSPFAVSDALATSPDILLLQESPSEEALGQLLEVHPGYDYQHGVDTSILVRGTITQTFNTPVYFQRVQATVDDIEYAIISLRLRTSTPRLDLWNPACWRDQTEVRDKQRAQLLAIADALPKNGPLIIGGDFNVPQGDGIFDSLKPELHESFAQAGRGWGNTIIADIPLLRIDQIWTNKALECIDARAKFTPHSDHRMMSAIFSY